MIEFEHDNVDVWFIANSCFRTSSLHYFSSKRKKINALNYTNFPKSPAFLWHLFIFGRLF